METVGQPSARRRGVRSCLFGTLLIGFGLMAPVDPAAAGRPDSWQLAAIGDGPATGAESDFGLGSNPLVERVQQALSQAGIYTGLITGRMNRATEDAIRAYQKGAGLTVDGQVSESLANHIETGKRVDDLLRKLQRTRQENVEAARQALLGDPATRDLIDGHRNEAADPTRDFTPCLKTPTTACLLAEAAESAKAIAKEDLRDWALGELLVAQARAGLADEARATARRIADPRLIMVALRDIAGGQAAAGRIADALEAAGIIPDPEKKTEALIAIAAIQAHGDGSAAVATLEGSQATLAQVDRPARRIALMCRMAVVLTAAGSRPAAEQTLAAAQDMARALSVQADSETALRNIAAALAEMGDPDGAIRILKDVRNGSDVTPILIAAAKAQAEAGDAEGALLTADGIEASRYKSVVFSRIALAQHRVGDATSALATLDKATAALDPIVLPFARDFANGRIALALTELAGSGRPDLFARSVERANAIADQRLRTQTLWTIAAAQRRADDREGAAATQTLAEAATRDMKSQLSRVWMFSDIAVQHHRNAETDAAWRAFGQGMTQAAEIGNAWGRTRALSRIAITLIELTEPGVDLPEFSERP